MTELTLRPTPGDPLGIVRALDAVDERFRSIACGLTEAQADWRPSRGGATVASALTRHLDGLRVYVPLLRSAVHGVRTTWRARLGEVRSGWWWQLLPLMGEFAPVVPWRAGGRRAARETRPVRALMGEILALHGEVRRLAREGEVRDLRTAAVRHPVLPGLRIPLDIALALVPAAARRQLRRAERVRLDPRFPSR